MKLQEQADTLAPLVAGLTTAATCLVVYLASLPPTLVEGDGGELVSAARCLGIPHPTGYPLYMLLARLFIFLPLSNPAVRVTLLSASSAALAAGIIAWATATMTTGPRHTSDGETQKAQAGRQQKGDRPSPGYVRGYGSALAGVAAGIVVGLNRPMWSQADKPEVYALNALLVALAIMLFVRWRRKPGPTGVIWLAVAAGLGLAHHRTALFAIVPLLACAWVGQREPRPSPGKVLGALGGPLLLYLYLPVRSLAHPAVMWLDASSWDNLVAHVGGREYLLYAFKRPLAEAVSLGGRIAVDSAAQLTLGGTVLCLIGLVALLRRERALSLCLIGSSAALTMWNLGYDVSDVVDFFIPVWLVLGLWMGEGVQVVRAAITRLLRSGMAWAPVGFGLAVVALLGVALVQRNWSWCNRHNDWRQYDRARAILAQIPENGIYSPYRDEFIALYLQQVEGYRREVEIIRPAGFYIAGRPYIAKPPLADALATPVQRFLESTGPDTTRQERCLAAVKFGQQLAENLEWTRPVYVGVNMDHPPQGGHVLARWRDLFQAAEKPPPPLPVPAAAAPLAQLTPEVSLQSCAVEPERVRPRDLLRITLDLECEREISRPVRLGIRLVPEGAVLDQSLVSKMLVDFDTWLAYGVLPLPPTPKGRIYRQEITVIAPTNAPAGAWSVCVRAGSSAQEWAELHEVGRFTVTTAK